MTKVKRNILRILLSIMLISFMTASTASATLILMDDWTLKVGGKYIDNIDFLNYTGISHVNTTDDHLPNGLSAGDTFTDDFVFKISPGDFENEGSGTITTYRDTSGIGVGDFELTGIVSLTGHHTAVDGDDADFVFDTGTFDMWLDLNSDATPGLGGGLVSGYADGIKISSYALHFGGGNFDFGDGDGNVDVTFLATMMLAGYMFENDGTDFNTYGSLLAAITDSNSDETTQAWPTNWTAYTGQVVGSESWDLNLDVDGSNRYAVIPEPATMLLLGSGLIGLAGFGRKKKFFKKD